MDFLRKRLPAQVGKYLEGVQFPAHKEELLGRLEPDAPDSEARRSANAPLAGPTRPPGGRGTRLPGASCEAGL